MAGSAGVDIEDLPPASGELPADTAAAQPAADGDVLGESIAGGGKKREDHAAHDRAASPGSSRNSVEPAALVRRAGHKFAQPIRTEHDVRVPECGGEEDGELIERWVFGIRDALEPHGLHSPGRPWHSDAAVHARIVRIRNGLDGCGAARHAGANVTT